MPQELQHNKSNSDIPQFQNPFTKDKKSDLNVKLSIVPSQLPFLFFLLFCVACADLEFAIADPQLLEANKWRRRG